MKRYSYEELCRGADIPWYLGRVYESFVSRHIYYDIIPLNYLRRWMRVLGIRWNRWRHEPDIIDLRFRTAIKIAKEDGWKAGYEYGEKSGMRRAMIIQECCKKKIIDEHEAKFDQPGGEA